MPTYDYRCEACGYTFAAFQSITEDALTTCPECGKESLRRLIGAGAGIIFKGSGFYETDYKRKRTGNSSRSGAKHSDSAEKTEKRSEKKSESEKKTSD